MVIKNRVTDQTTNQNMRFLNKSRYKAIKTNGLRKYITYAIGEIVLVVIGILIALWINNWNQTQKENNRQRYVAQNVLEQMNKDVLEIDKVIKEMDLQDEIYELMLMERTPTKEEKLTLFQNAPFLVTVGFTILSLEPKVVNELSKTDFTDTELKELMNSIESEYNQAHNTFRLNEETIVKELLSNLNYLKDNYDWYYKLINGGNLDVSEYAYFGSSDYKNRVAHMQLIAMESYYSDLAHFQNLLEKNIITLETILAAEEE
jgi:hypothetical protein